MGLVEELEKLRHLRDSGVLDEEEFRRAKQRLLEEGAPAAKDAEQKQRHQQRMRQWAMLLHLAPLALVLLPGVGAAVPLVLWQWKRSEFPELDDHGLEVTNWSLSLLLYSIPLYALSYLPLVGWFPLYIGLVVLVLFAVRGAAKASRGETPRYWFALPLISRAKNAEQTGGQ